LRTIIINKTKYSLGAAAFCCAALALTPAEAGSQHVYTIRLDANLKQLQVEALFDPPARNIAARSGNAEQFLINAQLCNGGDEIPTRGRRLLISQSGIECLQYSVDLRRAVRADQRNESLHSDNIIVSPTVWMWRPRLGVDDRIEVRFELPDGIQVSVPWQPDENSPNHYHLLASPQSGIAMSIFGRFDAQRIDVAGSSLRVDLLRSEQEIDNESIVAWIRDTAYNIARAYGRFPNPDARIVVLPAGRVRGNAPVQFGRVVRDGGETVELMIDPARPMQSFYENWTATHEFSHLMLPYLQSEQRWVSDGFSQYYQNVLLARAGRYTQRYAWQKILDGLERGRESVPRLSPNDAASGDERSSRMKVYWSGAALALLADVELRRRSNGEQTLDAVLGQFQECCLPSQRTWTGKELFTKFDSFLAEPLFMNLYREHADTVGFPAVEPLLRELGVTRIDDQVRLGNAAELAQIRIEMTGRDASIPQYASPPRDH